MTVHPASYHVVEEVARKDGVAPSDLSPPLNSVIDPDALDALVDGQEKPAGGSVVVEFRYRGYVVRVRDGPTVSVSVLDVDSNDASEETAEQHDESEE